MNPPSGLHEAFLTAGNNLQPIGDWITVNWLPLTILAAALTFAAWALRRFIRGGLRDYRTHNDRVMADRYTRHRPTPEQQQPGNDLHLLIDAELAYGDTESLTRLRTTIHQHRKETQQP